MAEKVTYYRLTWPGAPPEDQPTGLARRVENDDRFDDQAFGANLNWHPTSVIVEWENGDASEQVERISEDEANELIERFRERWANL